MADAKTAVPDVDPTESDQGEVLISQWEFVNRIPTRDEVLVLLATLRPVWGVKTVDFADYVQALPQRKKIKAPHPENPNVKVDEYLDCYTLYMSVAGRLKMLEEAAEAHGWSVDFLPEQHTPTGMPGYLAWEPRLVYREYVVIEASIRDLGGDPVTGQFRPLGRKPGTAWVPYTGGSQAAGSNPFEKVETSARGRAIAAWGFGVLPGSGVASVEEIQGARGNKAAIEAEGSAPVGRGDRRKKSRQEQLEETLSLMEQLRQKRGHDEATAREKTSEYLHKNLGVVGVYDAEKDEMRWDRVSPGQLVILANNFRDALAKIAGEEAPV